MNNEIRIEVNVTITDEDIDDIMSSALFGGISYWCSGIEVVGGYLGNFASEQIGLGGKIKFFVEEPFDDNETECYTLDKEMILKGLGKYISEYGGCVWRDRSYKLDEWVIDSALADTVVQLALFGEVVYG